MLVIRLSRGGAKNRPFYKLVVAEQDFCRDGRFVEKLGYYNPDKNHQELKADRERIQYWIGKGAQPSPAIKKLLKTFKA